MSNNGSYDFDKAVAEWGVIPVDDVGYIPTTTLLQLSDPQLVQLIMLARQYRYHAEGWRNKDNSLMGFMGADSCKGKVVCELGCGFGIDALTYASRGAEVILADISPYTLVVARRVLALAGAPAQKMMIVLEGPPYFETYPKPVDLFWAMGVLHHTPKAAEIIDRAFSVLKVQECRIVLYSDKRWEILMKEPVPPVEQPITEHPRCMDWVRLNDEVGQYADWYSPERIRAQFGSVGQVVETPYIGDGQLIGAVIRR